MLTNRAGLNPIHNLNLPIARYHGANALLTLMPTLSLAKKAKGKLSDPDVLVDLVSRISEGIYITNAAGTIIDANPGFLRLMGLKYAVITSVARDDLPDQGTDVWAETIRQVHLAAPECRLEVLIPDMQGNLALVDRTAATPALP